MGQHKLRPPVEKKFKVNRYDLATKLDVAGYVEHRTKDVAKLIDAYTEQLSAEIRELNARIVLLEATPWEKLKLWVESFIEKFFEGEPSDDLLTYDETSPVAIDTAVAGGRIITDTADEPVAEEGHGQPQRRMTPDELEANGYPRNYHELPREVRDAGKLLTANPEE